MGKWSNLQFNHQVVQILAILSDVFTYIPSLLTSCHQKNVGMLQAWRISFSCVGYAVLYPYVGRPGKATTKRKIQNKRGAKKSTQNGNYLTHSACMTWFSSVWSIETKHIPIIMSSILVSSTVLVLSIAILVSMASAQPAGDRFKHSRELAALSREYPRSSLDMLREINRNIKKTRASLRLVISMEREMQRTARNIQRSNIVSLKNSESSSTPFSSWAGWY